MDSIKALPSRPLTGDEIQVLDESDKFAALTPINSVFDPEHNDAFVVGLVLITEHLVVAAQYDMEERMWINRYEQAAETQEEREEAYPEAERMLEQAAEDLESVGVVSEVVEEEHEEGVNQALREAGDFPDILREHYEDAT